MRLRLPIFRTAVLTVTSATIATALSLGAVPASQAGTLAGLEEGAGRPAPQNTVKEPTPEPLLPPQPGPYTPTTPDTGATGSFDGLSAGTTTLVRDLADKTISATSFTKFALGELGYGYGVPKKYRGDRTSADLAVLSLLVNDNRSRVSNADKNAITRTVREYSSGTDGRSQAGPSAAETAATGGTLDCSTKFRLHHNWYECLYATDHFDIWFARNGDYAVSSLTDASGGGTTGTSPNGVPDTIDETAATLERSYDVYDDLGYDMPDGDSAVFVNSVLSGPAGSAPPGARLSPLKGYLGQAIHLPRSYEEWYLPGHELFHLVQYEYLAGIPSAPTTALRVAAVIRLTWWLEASAEWAAQQVLQASSPAEGEDADDDRDWVIYARSTDDFYKGPGRALDANDGFGGPRQYGEVALVEFLTMRFGTDVVRHTWESAGLISSIDNPTSPLENTLKDYGSSFTDEAELFWASSYQVCDPNHSAWNGVPAWVDSDVAVDEDQWCEDYLDDFDGLGLSGPGYPTARMPHETWSTLTEDPTATTATVELGDGGAWFTDVTGDDGSEGTVTLTVTPARETFGAPEFAVRVMQWNETPGDRCDTDQLEEVKYPDTLEVTFDQSASCPHATVQVTNIDIEGEDSEIFTVNASRTATSTVVSNGLIQLGVNETGELDVDYDTPSADGTYPLGLRYIPTRNEALAPGCLCEGWGLKATPALGGEVVAGGVTRNSGPDNVDLTSFTSDGVEATSITTVGSYSVKHHYHPSPDPRLYQVDVSIFNPVAFDNPEVIYRRVMDFDVEPTAFNESMTVLVDPSDRDWVVATTDNGFLDPNPVTAPYPRMESGEFTDLGPADLGASWDFDVTPTALFQPIEFTLYYGAGKDTADALDALQEVGVGTYALAKPASDPVGGSPNTFVFGFKPPQATEVP